MLPVAQLGPITSLFEAFATAIGAGMLLGSFAMGVVGPFASWPRKVLEGRVLTDGYFGGILGFAAAVIDAVLRYLL